MIKNVLFVQPFEIIEEQLSYILLTWPVYLYSYLNSKIDNLNYDLLYLPAEQKRGNLNIEIPDNFKAFDLDSFYSKMDRLVFNLDFPLERQASNLIAISCSFSPLYFSSKLTIKYFQERFPDALIVVGGSHASAYPQDFIEKDFLIDYVIPGEGEIPFYKIIRDNAKKQKTPVISEINPVPDLNTLPNLDFSIFNNYIDLFNNLSISLSRGCPFKCHFCMERGLTDGNKSIKPWRSYKPKRALQETQIMIEYGQSHEIKKFGFTDSLFALNKSWLIDFLDNFKFESEIPFVIETRLDILDKYLVERLEKKNFLSMYGLESFSTSTLSAMGKTSNPKRFLKRFKEIYEIHKRLENKFAINILINHPGETLESMNLTFDELDKLINDSVDIEQLNLRLFHNFPGTELYRNIESFHEVYGTKVYPPSIEWWKKEQKNVLKFAPYCVRSSSELSLKKSIKNYTERYKKLIQIGIDNFREKRSTQKEGIVIKILSLKKYIENLEKRSEELLNFLSENNIESEEECIGSAN